MLDVELAGVEREQALDDDLALLGRENVQPLELQQVVATCGGESHELAVREDPQGLVVRAERRPIAYVGEIRKPVERPLDIRLRETGAFERMREIATLRHLRRFREHV